MNIQRQMEWVARNRTRRDRSVAAGAAISRFAESLWTDSIEPLEDVAEALAEIVDAEFCARCRIAGWQRGILRIHVDEPAQVSLMRIQWASHIKRELSGRLRCGVTQVSFTPGTSGTSLLRHQRPGLSDPTARPY